MISWSNNRKTGVGDITDLINEINEQKLEQKRILEIFNNNMTNFATDRSIESCIDALNTSIQLSNVRSKLVRSYEYYSKKLEEEIIKLNYAIEKKSK